MSNQIIPVHQMTPEQAAAIATLHERELPSLLAELGRPVLERFYYGLGQNSNSFGFILLDDGKVRGWVVGGSDPGGSFRQTVQPLIPFLFHLLRLAWQRPGVLVQLVASLAGRHPASLHPPGSVELLFIAVHPDERGKGSAGRLFSAFLWEARNRKHSGVTLSVESDNERALQFYLRSGFTEIGEVTEGKYHRKRMYFSLTAA
jgi:ribosomal protein S18 acetylase RimI-like enzyme